MKQQRGQTTWIIERVGKRRVGSMHCGTYQEGGVSGEGPVSQLIEREDCEIGYTLLSSDFSDDATLGGKGRDHMADSAPPTSELNEALRFHWIT